MMKVLKALVVLVAVVAIGYDLYDIVTPKQYTYEKHTIKAGETLIEIARNYGVKSTEKDVEKIVWDICILNKISKQEVVNLQPGRVILVPIQK